MFSLGVIIFNVFFFFVAFLCVWLTAQLYTSSITVCQLFLQDTTAYTWGSQWQGFFL